MSTLLGEAVRLAKQHGLKIETKKYGSVMFVTVEQPPWSGFGKIEMRVPKSHRVGDLLRIMGASHFLPTTLKNTAWTFEIDNTPDIKNKLDLFRIKATIRRGTKPKAIFKVFDNHAEVFQ